MSPLVRYSLLQVPGIVILGTLLVIWVGTGWLSPAWGLLLMGLWLLKDALLYPLYRPALKGAAPTGGKALVGQRARALTPVIGTGYVGIRGERWEARSADGRAIAQGEPVEVVSAEGLHLLVRPWEDPPGQGGRQAGKADAGETGQPGGPGNGLELGARSTDRRGGSS